MKNPSMKPIESSKKEASNIIESSKTLEKASMKTVESSKNIEIARFDEIPRQKPSTCIDVSEHQGSVDWEAVRGHVDGVLLRAGWGQGRADRQFVRNAEECARLGIPMGAYWFSYACDERQAKAEAEALLETVAPFELTLPLAFDFEYDSLRHALAQGVTLTAPQVRAMATAFCGAVEAAGCWCMLYANPDFLARYFEPLTARFDLWLAQWPNAVDVTAPPRACGIWQWGLSEVPGISGQVDTNAAYRDYPAFLREVGRVHRADPAEADESGTTQVGNAVLSVPQAGNAPGERNAGDGVPYAPSNASDQPANSAPWYAAAMAWAQDNGVCDGTRPLEPATRAEVAQMFFNLTHGGA